MLPQPIPYSLTRVKSIAGHLGKLLLKSGKAETPGQMESSGVPIVRKILEIVTIGRLKKLIPSLSHWHCMNPPYTLYEMGG